MSTNDICSTPHLAEANSTVAAVRANTLAAKCSLLAELAKIRLTAMVVITTGVGFAISTAGLHHWLLLLWTVLGTWLLAAAAAAINQILEVAPDSRMNRTCRRPLPAGELSRSSALIFAIVTAVSGAGLLLVLVNPLVAALGAANLVIYAFIYTPLKPRTTLNTLVGAICGAIPPMMGVAAATGRLTAAAWLLGAVLFVWQIPHFLALAWLYRDDYIRGGFRMLPVIDPAGRITCLMIVLYSVLLIAVTLGLAFFGVAGGWYAPLATVLGLLLLVQGLRLAADHTRESARRVFLASVLYLPALLVLLLVCHTPVHATVASAAPVATAPVQLTPAGQ